MVPGSPRAHSLPFSLDSDSHKRFHFWAEVVLSGHSVGCRCHPSQGTGHLACTNGHAAARSSITEFKGTAVGWTWLGLALQGGMVSWIQVSVPLGSFLPTTPDQPSLGSVLVSEVPQKCIPVGNRWRITVVPSQMREAVFCLFVCFAGLLRAFSL